MGSTPTPSRLARSVEDYKRLGIKKGEIEQWEDGMRTSGGKGTYEWWYFDAHLNDASKVVIVFYTKNLVDVGKPLDPYIAITFDRPDGSHLEKEYHTPPKAFSSSKETCDVSIGPNTFKGDLHEYHIHAEAEGISCDLTLTGTVPAWRPETGQLFFGERSEHYFAWLPAVPQGDVEVTITANGKTEQFTGIGYHDHNWGNISPAMLINHWYWARGKIGDYTVIASHITAAKKYGYKTFSVFMFAHNGKILADDGSKVQYSHGDIRVDERTGKPVANTLVYDYTNGSERYLLTFKRKKTILRMKLIEGIHGMQALLARLVRFDGTFTRFIGDLAIEHYVDEKLIASEQEEAIWELMYLGHVRKG